MSISPTGTQYRIAKGDFAAVIGEVGATLQSLTWQGAEVLQSLPEGEPFKPWFGTSLAPWPNRVRDGRYTFDGEALQLPINEPERACALHGLAYALEWRLVERTDEHVTLSATVYPQVGWPGICQVESRFEVVDEGLQVTWRAKNVGSVAFPFGYGSHVYFRFDDLAEVVLTSPFEQELYVDERLLPTELGELSPEHDFRTARPLGDATFDTAFTAAPTGWEVAVEGCGRTVSLWGDEHHPWIQVFTHPDLPAIAIEPMTCGPNAFNEGITHDDALRLEPGDEASGTWGIRVQG